MEPQKTKRGKKTLNREPTGSGAQEEAPQPLPAKIPSQDTATPFDKMDTTTRGDGQDPNKHHPEKETRDESTQKPLLEETQDEEMQEAVIEQ